MSPKNKLVTLSWCSVTMICTLVLSHGHLIMREIIAHWPHEDSWESRLQNALYAQGGLALLASLTISLALLIRGFLTKQSDEASARRELALRERHERAAEERHTALLNSLAALDGSQQEPANGQSSARGTIAKKSYDSGVKAK